MKGFSSKRIVLKVDVIWSQKIDCLQGFPCTFSPGILQAGAVKGLILTTDFVSSIHCIKGANV